MAPTIAPVANTPVPVKQPKEPKPVAAPKAEDRSTVAGCEPARVQRIVRRVDAWSVMKVSFVFFIVDVPRAACRAACCSGRSRSAPARSTTSRTSSSELFALDSFSFVGAQILRASVIGGALLVIAGTFTTTVLAVLFNLISDLVGGVRFTVVEEQVLRPRVAASARPGVPRARHRLTDRRRTPG